MECNKELNLLFVKEEQVRCFVRGEITFKELLPEGFNVETDILSVKYFVQWEDLIVFLKTLQKKNPTMKEYYDNWYYTCWLMPDNIGFLSSDDMKNIKPSRMSDHNRPHPISPAECMYFIYDCMAFCSWVYTVIETEYSGFCCNDCLNIPGLLYDIEKARNGKVEIVCPEIWSVNAIIDAIEVLLYDDCIIYKDFYNESRLATLSDEQTFGIRFILDELERRGFKEAIEMKLKCIYEGNRLYPLSHKNAAHYITYLMDREFGEEDMKRKQSYSALLGVFCFEGADDDPPDYDKAFRYFSYAFTGQFYKPFGIFAELFENEDREALMTELGHMKEKAVNQFNLNI